MRPGVLVGDDLIRCDLIAVFVGSCQRDRQRRREGVIESRAVILSACQELSHIVLECYAEVPGRV